MIKMNGIQPLMCFETDGINQFDSKYIPSLKDIVLITTPNSRLIPFCYKTPSGDAATVVDNIYLVDYHSGSDFASRSKIDILSYVSDITIDLTTDGDYFIRNFGQTDLSTDLNDGIYYLKVNYSNPSTSHEFYTDVFSIGDVSNMIKIEYYHNSDTEDFIFQNSYKNIFYLDVNVKDMYDPDVEYESVNNNNNKPIRYFKREYEKFRLTKFIGHRNTAKMFTHMAFYSNCEITNQNSEIAIAENIEVEYSPQESTEYTEVDFAFRVETFTLPNTLSNLSLTTRTIEDELSDVLLDENGNDILEG